LSRGIGHGRTLAKGAAGFLAGVALWAGLSEPYHRTLAAPAQALIRTFESPSVTRLRAEKREIIFDREDFPPSSPRPGIPADDLDFNVAILAALFATVRRPFSDASLKKLSLALALLWATHVAAIVFAVENIDATSLGEWSAAHYGWAARNFWATGHHFYRIAGMFAAPFILWWALGRPEFALRANASPTRRDTPPRR
jgi:uncharacterized membrane protein